MSVVLRLEVQPPVLGALGGAKMLDVRERLGDMEGGNRSLHQRNDAKAKPALRLHLGQAEEVMVGVFHHILLSRNVWL